MEALSADLRARLEAARRGGSESARKLHTSRGKLLPRERVEHRERFARIVVQHGVPSERAGGFGWAAGSPCRKHRRKAVKGS